MRVNTLNNLKLNYSKVFNFVKPSKPRKNCNIVIAKNMSGSSNTNSDINNPRLVIKKVLAESRREGDGATVRRSIGRFDFTHFFIYVLF